METLSQRRDRIVEELRRIHNNRLEAMKTFQAVVSEFDAKMQVSTERWNAAKAELDALIIEVTRPVEEKFADKPPEWWKSAEADGPAQFLDDWLTIGIEEYEYERLTYEIDWPDNRKVADDLQILSTEFHP